MTVVIQICVEKPQQAHSNEKLTVKPQIPGEKQKTYATGRTISRRAKFERPDILQENVDARSRLWKQATGSSEMQMKFSQFQWNLQI